jgi:hypothetical protein
MGADQAPETACSGSECKIIDKEQKLVIPFDCMLQCKLKNIILCKPRTYVSFSPKIY